MKRRKNTNKYINGVKVEKNEMPAETRKKIHKLLSNAMALSMTISTFSDYSVQEKKSEKEEK